MRPQIRSGIRRGGAARFVVNPDPERGMLSSLQCGLAALPPEAEAVMFMPVDQPDLERSTLEKLIGGFQRRDALPPPSPRIGRTWAPGIDRSAR